MYSPCNQINKFKLCQSLSFLSFFYLPVARRFLYFLDPDLQHRISLSEKQIKMSETTTLKARNVMLPQSALLPVLAELLIVLVHL